MLQEIGLSQQRLAGRPHLVKGGVDNGLAGDEDGIPPWLDISQAKSHRLAHQSPGPVALHCIANASAGRKPKATVRQIVGEGDQDDQAMLIASPLATNLLEAVFGPQTVTPAHG